MNDFTLKLNSLLPVKKKGRFFIRLYKLIKAFWVNFMIVVHDRVIKFESMNF